MLWIIATNSNPQKDAWIMLKSWKLLEIMEDTEHLFYILETRVWAFFGLMIYYIWVADETIC